MYGTAGATQPILPRLPQLTSLHRCRLPYCPYHRAASTRQPRGNSRCQSELLFLARSLASLISQSHSFCSPLNYTHAHSTTPQLEFGERLISPPLPFFHVVSEENFTEEGIPSPLAPSLLVAFYDTQRIRWCYSLLYAQHHRAYCCYFISNPRRGCYMGLSTFIFFLFFFRHFCPGHNSGTVTRRDSKLSVLLGPAV